MFYRDTIAMRAEDIGLENFESLIARNPGMSDADYLNRICEIVSNKFGGYSVFRVQGRFKVGDLITRNDAGLCLANDQPYLIDETTAAVRFIVPCSTGQRSFQDEVDLVSDALKESGFCGYEGP